MECQIVPNVKVNDVTKLKSSKSKSRHSCSEDDLKRLYSIQPIFKPPKSTFDIMDSSDESFTQEPSRENSNDTSFNHFRMSRPGKANSPDNFQEITHKSPIIVSYELSKDSKAKTIVITDSTATNRRESKTASSVGPRRKSSTDICRSSIGDEPSFTGVQSVPKSRKSLTGLSPVPSLVVSISEEPTPSQNGSNSKHLTVDGRERSQSSKGPRTLTDAQLDSSLGKRGDLPRRKSMFEGRGPSMWYSLENRRLSTEDVDCSRRNVISPCTLERLQADSEAGVMVCTEEDWKLYDNNIPLRKLISHRKLNHDLNLPYNDNIGLEETVTSHQAKLCAKSKPRRTEKKQTPKQVWYRTVRSIMAANHLYHQVANKNKAKG